MPVLPQPPSQPSSTVTEKSLSTPPQSSNILPPALAAVVRRPPKELGQPSSLPPLAVFPPEPATCDGQALDAVQNLRQALSQCEHTFLWTNVTIQDVALEEPIPYVVTDAGGNRTYIYTKFLTCDVQLVVLTTLPYVQFILRALNAVASTMSSLSMSSLPTGSASSYTIRSCNPTSTLTTSNQFSQLETLSAVAVDVPNKISDTEPVRRNKTITKSRAANKAKLRRRTKPSPLADRMGPSAFTKISQVSDPTVGFPSHRQSYRPASSRIHRNAAGMFRTLAMARRVPTNCGDSESRDTDLEFEPDTDTEPFSDFDDDWSQAESGGRGDCFSGDIDDLLSFRAASDNCEYSATSLPKPKLCQSSEFQVDCGVTSIEINNCKSLLLPVGTAHLDKDGRTIPDMEHSAFVLPGNNAKEISCRRTGAFTDLVGAGDSLSRSNSRGTSYDGEEACQTIDVKVFPTNVAKDLSRDVENYFGSEARVDGSHEQSVSIKSDFESASLHEDELRPTTEIELSRMPRPVPPVQGGSPNMIWQGEHSCSLLGLRDSSLCLRTSEMSGDQISLAANRDSCSVIHSRVSLYPAGKSDNILNGCCQNVSEELQRKSAEPTCPCIAFSGTKVQTANGTDMKERYALFSQSSKCSNEIELSLKEDNAMDSLVFPASSAVSERTSHSGEFSSADAYRAVSAAVMALTPVVFPFTDGIDVSASFGKNDYKPVFSCCSEALCSSWRNVDCPHTGDIKAVEQAPCCTCVFCSHVLRDTNRVHLSKTGTFSGQMPYQRSEEMQNSAAIDPPVPVNSQQFGCPSKAKDAITVGLPALPRSTSRGEIDLSATNGLVADDMISLRLADAAHILCAAPPAVIVSTVASLMEEKRVVVVANSSSYLSRAVLSFAALIFPFEWPHMLVPSLPQPLLPYLAAPCPFLVGVLDSLLPEATIGQPVDDIVYVFLEPGNMRTVCTYPEGDPAKRLPRKLRTRLLRRLHKLRNTEAGLDLKADASARATLQSERICSQYKPALFRTPEISYQFRHRCAAELSDKLDTSLNAALYSPGQLEKEYENPGKSFQSNERFRVRSAVSKSSDLAPCRRDPCSCANNSVAARTNTFAQSPHVNTAASIERLPACCASGYQVGASHGRQRDHNRDFTVQLGPSQRTASEIGSNSSTGWSFFGQDYEDPVTSLNRIMAKFFYALLVGRSTPSGVVDSVVESSGRAPFVGPVFSRRELEHRECVASFKRTHVYLQWEKNAEPCPPDFTFGLKQFQAAAPRLVKRSALLDAAERMWAKRRQANELPTSAKPSASDESGLPHESEQVCGPVSGETGRNKWSGPAKRSAKNGLKPGGMKLSRGLISDKNQTPVMSAQPTVAPQCSDLGAVNAEYIVADAEQSNDISCDSRERESRIFDEFLYFRESTGYVDILGEQASCLSSDYRAAQEAALQGTDVQDIRSDASCTLDQRPVTVCSHVPRVGNLKTGYTSESQPCASTIGKEDCSETEPCSSDREDGKERDSPKEVFVSERKLKLRYGVKRQLKIAERSRLVSRRKYRDGDSDGTDTEFAHCGKHFLKVVEDPLGKMACAVDSIESANAQICNASRDDVKRSSQSTSSCEKTEPGPAEDKAMFETSDIVEFRSLDAEKFESTKASTNRSWASSLYRGGWFKRLGNPPEAFSDIFLKRQAVRSCEKEPKYDGAIITSENIDVQISEFKGLDCDSRDVKEDDQYLHRRVSESADCNCSLRETLDLTETHVLQVHPLF